MSIFREIKEFFELIGWWGSFVSAIAPSSAGLLAHFFSLPTSGMIVVVLCSFVIVLCPFAMKVHLKRRMGRTYYSQTMQYLGLNWAMALRDRFGYEPKTDPCDPECSKCGIPVMWTEEMFLSKCSCECQECKEIKNFDDSRHIVFMKAKNYMLAQNKKDAFKWA